MAETTTSARAGHAPWVPTTADGRALPTWARDATLGIFVHWGAYSVPAWAEPFGTLAAGEEEEWFAHTAYAEWYANTIRIEGSPAASHHEQEHGGRSYVDFLDEWQAEAYDPIGWAELFKQMGADYVVPTTKHHDGIALWDAPGAALTTVTRGPHRDLIGPLAHAVRAEGMRFGVYYSGGLDWSVSDTRPHLSNEHIEQFRPKDGDYHAYAARQVRDLIRRYQPELLWNDIEWPDAGKSLSGPESLESLISDYRALVPDGIVNDRWGAEIWDFRTSEYDAHSENESGAGWEHCRGLGLSFGYNRQEDESHTLSPRELASLYADIVSRGGRLLLNVGPTAAGEIPPAQRRTLESVAGWLTAIKPHTIGRGALRRDEIEVLDAAWWRAWSTPSGALVVVDSPAASVRSLTGSPVTVVALPG